MTDDMIPVPAAAVEKLREALAQYGLKPGLYRAARALVDAVPRETDEEPSIIDMLSEGIRNAECICGHPRDAHACTFTSVRCICGCTEFRTPPAPAAPPEPVCQLPHWHILDDRCEPSPLPVSAEEAWEARIAADFQKHPGSWRPDPQNWYREGWIAGWQAAKEDDRAGS